MNKWIEEINRSNQNLTRKEIMILGPCERKVIDAKKVDGVDITHTMPIDEKLLMDAATTAIQRYFGNKVMKIEFVALERLVKSLILDVEVLSTKQESIPRAKFDTVLKEFFLKVLFPLEHEKNNQRELKPDENHNVLDDLEIKKGPKFEDLQHVHDLYRAKKFSEGLAIIDALIQKFGENNTVELAEFKAEGLAGQENYADAIEWYIKAYDFEFSIYENSPRKSIYSLYFGGGNPLAHLREWRVHLNQRAGLALRQLGRWEEAKKVYKFILDDNPEQRSKKIMYAESIMLCSGEYTEAMGLLKEVVSNPSDPNYELVARFYLMVGFALEDKGKEFFEEKESVLCSIRRQKKDSRIDRHFPFPWDLSPALKTIAQKISEEMFDPLSIFARWLEARITDDEFVSEFGFGK